VRRKIRRGMDVDVKECEGSEYRGCTYEAGAYDTTAVNPKEMNVRMGEENRVVSR